MQITGGESGGQNNMRGLVDAARIEKRCPSTSGPVHATSSQDLAYYADPFISIY